MDQQTITAKALNQFHESSTTVGRRAESFVADVLTRQGYTVVAKNWRHQQFEVDIIAESPTYRLFIEVKYRKNNTHAFESVDEIKIRHLCTAVQRFRSTYHKQPVIVICGVTGTKSRLTLHPPIVYEL